MAPEEFIAEQAIHLVQSDADGLWALLESVAPDERCRLLSMLVQRGYSRSIPNWILARVWREITERMKQHAPSKKQ